MDNKNNDCATDIFFIDMSQKQYSISNKYLISRTNRNVQKYYVYVVTSLIHLTQTSTYINLIPFLLHMLCALHLYWPFFSFTLSFVFNVASGLSCRGLLSSMLGLCLPFRLSSFVLKVARDLSSSVVYCNTQ